MTTVVLGYVPKPEGEAALAAAISEAKLRSADVAIVNAHRARHDDSGWEQRMTTELAEVQERVEAEGITVQIRTPQSELEPADDLISIAAELDADLIVIGLRRRTPVGKLILGSSAQRILLDAHCPVLAVKSDG
jgi:nucleotide-binding universal stress UspA family protein